MQRDEIEAWLSTSLRSTIQLLRLEANWWPTTAPENQKRASAWALNFFVEAALTRASGRSLVASCSASPDKKPLNHTIITSRWSDRTAGRSHQNSQVLVDFSVHNWAAASPIQVTGESETYASHGVDDEMDGANDYSWDFYKLLVIPSTTRLFFARVGGRDGQTAEQRAETLAQTLKGLVDLYGPAMLRPHDELGVAIVPSKKAAQQSTHILWTDRGRLRGGPIEVPLLPSSTSSSEEDSEQSEDEDPE